MRYKSNNNQFSKIKVRNKLTNDIEYYYNVNYYSHNNQAMFIHYNDGFDKEILPFRQYQLIRAWKK